MRKRTYAPQFLARPRELYGTEHHVDPPETRKRIHEASALCDEPEKVGPAILDAYGESARYYETLRHQAQVQAAQEARKQLTPEQRLAGVLERAKRQHTDVASETRLIGRLLERAARGGRRAPQTAIDKLTRLEAKLDGAPPSLSDDTNRK